MLLLTFRKKPVLPNHALWYMVSKLIAEFNGNWKRIVAAFVFKLLDESM
jgi:hypothetical protein